MPPLIMRHWGWQVGARSLLAALGISLLSCGNRAAASGPGETRPVVVTSSVSLDCSHTSSAVPVFVQDMMRGLPLPPRGDGDTVFHEQHREALARLDKGAYFRLLQDLVERGKMVKEDADSAANRRLRLTTFQLAHAGFLRAGELVLEAATDGTSGGTATAADVDPDRRAAVFGFLSGLRAVAGTADEWEALLLRDPAKGKEQEAPDAGGKKELATEQNKKAAKHARARDAKKRAKALTAGAESCSTPGTSSGNSSTSLRFTQTEQLGSDEVGLPHEDLPPRVSVARVRIALDFLLALFRRGTVSDRLSHSEQLLTRAAMELVSKPEQGGFPDVSFRLFQSLHGLVAEYVRFLGHFAHAGVAVATDAGGIAPGGAATRQRNTRSVAELVFTRVAIAAEACRGGSVARAIFSSSTPLDRRLLLRRNRFFASGVLDAVSSRKAEGSHQEESPRGILAFEHAPFLEAAAGFHTLLAENYLVGGSSSSSSSFSLPCLGGSRLVGEWRQALGDGSWGYWIESLGAEEQQCVLGDSDAVAGAAGPIQVQNPIQTCHAGLMHALTAVLGLPPSEEQKEGEASMEVEEVERDREELLQGSAQRARAWRLLEAAVSPGDLFPAGRCSRLEEHLAPLAQQMAEDLLVSLAAASSADNKQEVGGGGNITLTVVDGSGKSFYGVLAAGGGLAAVEAIAVLLLRPTMDFFQLLPAEMSSSLSGGSTSARSAYDENYAPDRSFVTDRGRSTVRASVCYLLAALLSLTQVILAQLQSRVSTPTLLAAMVKGGRSRERLAGEKSLQRAQHGAGRGALVLPTRSKGARSAKQSTNKLREEAEGDNDKLSEKEKRYLYWLLAVTLDATSVAGQYQLRYLLDHGASKEDLDSCPRHVEFLILHVSDLETSTQSQTKKKKKESETTSVSEFERRFRALAGAAQAELVAAGLPLSDAEQFLNGKWLRQYVDFKRGLNLEPFFAAAAAGSSSDSTWLGSAVEKELFDGVPQVQTFLRFDDLRAEGVAGVSRKTLLPAGFTFGPGAATSASAAAASGTATTEAGSTFDPCCAPEDTHQSQEQAGLVVVSSEQTTGPSTARPHFPETVVGSLLPRWAASFKSRCENAVEAFRAWHREQSQQSWDESNEFCERMLNKVFGEVDGGCGATSRMSGVDASAGGGSSRTQEGAQLQGPDADRRAASPRTASPRPPGKKLPQSWTLTGQRAVLPAGAFVESPKVEEDEEACSPDVLSSLLGEPLPQGAGRGLHLPAGTHQGATRRASGGGTRTSSPKNNERSAQEVERETEAFRWLQRCVPIAGFATAQKVSWLGRRARSYSVPYLWPGGEAEEQHEVQEDWVLAYVHTPLSRDFSRLLPAGLFDAPRFLKKRREKLLGNVLGRDATSSTTLCERLHPWLFEKSRGPGGVSDHTHEQLGAEAAQWANQADELHYALCDGGATYELLLNYLHWRNPASGKEPLASNSPMPALVLRQQEARACYVLAELWAVQAEHAATWERLLWAAREGSSPVEEGVEAEKARCRRLRMARRAKAHAQQTAHSYLGEAEAAFAAVETQLLLGGGAGSLRAVIFTSQQNNSNLLRGERAGRKGLLSGRELQLQQPSGEPGAHAQQAAQSLLKRLCGAGEKITPLSLVTAEQLVPVAQQLFLLADGFCHQAAAKVHWKHFAFDDDYLRATAADGFLDSKQLGECAKDVLLPALAELLDVTPLLVDLSHTLRGYDMLAQRWKEQLKHDLASGSANVLYTVGTHQVISFGGGSTEEHARTNSGQSSAGGKRGGGAAPACLDANLVLAKVLEALKQGAGAGQTSCEAGCSSPLTTLPIKPRPPPTALPAPPSRAPPSTKAGTSSAPASRAEKLLEQFFAKEVPGFDGGTAEFFPFALLKSEAAFLETEWLRDLRFLTNLLAAVPHEDAVYRTETLGSFRLMSTSTTTAEGGAGVMGDNHLPAACAVESSGTSLSPTRNRKKFRVVEHKQYSFSMLAAWARRLEEARSPPDEEETPVSENRHRKLVNLVRALRLAFLAKNDGGPAFTASSRYSHSKSNSYLFLVQCLFFLRARFDGLFDLPYQLASVELSFFNDAGEEQPVIDPVRSFVTMAEAEPDADLQAGYDTRTGGVPLQFFQSRLQGPWTPPGEEPRKEMSKKTLLLSGAHADAFWTYGELLLDLLDTDFASTADGGDGRNPPDAVPGGRGEIADSSGGRLFVVDDQGVLQSDETKANGFEANNRSVRQRFLLEAEKVLVAAWHSWALVLVERLRKLRAARETAGTRSSKGRRATSVVVAESAHAVVLRAWALREAVAKEQRKRGGHDQEKDGPAPLAEVGGEYEAEGLDGDESERLRRVEVAREFVREAKKIVDAADLRGLHISRAPESEIGGDPDIVGWRALGDQHMWRACRKKVLVPPLREKALAAFEAARKGTASIRECVKTVTDLAFEDEVAEVEQGRGILPAITVDGLIDVRELAKLELAGPAQEDVQDHEAGGLVGGAPMPASLEGDAEAELLRERLLRVTESLIDVWTRARAVDAAGEASSSDQKAADWLVFGTTNCHTARTAWSLKAGRAGGRFKTLRTEMMELRDVLGGGGTMKGGETIEVRDLLRLRRGKGLVDVLGEKEKEKESVELGLEQKLVRMLDSIAERSSGIDFTAELGWKFVGNPGEYWLLYILARLARRSVTDGEQQSPANGKEALVLGPHNCTGPAAAGGDEVEVSVGADAQAIDELVRQLEATGLAAPAETRKTKARGSALRKGRAPEVEVVHTTDPGAVEAPSSQPVEGSEPIVQSGASSPSALAPKAPAAEGTTSSAEFQSQCGSCTSGSTTTGATATPDVAPTPDPAPRLRVTSAATALPAPGAKKAQRPCKAARKKKQRQLQQQAQEGERMKSLQEQEPPQEDQVGEEAEDATVREAGATATGDDIVPDVVDDDHDTEDGLVLPRDEQAGGAGVAVAARLQQEPAPRFVRKVLSGSDLVAAGSTSRATRVPTDDLAPDDCDADCAEDYHHSSCAASVSYSSLGPSPSERAGSTSAHTSPLSATSNPASNPDSSHLQQLSASTLAALGMLDDDGGEEPSGRPQTALDVVPELLKRLRAGVFFALGEFVEAEPRFCSGEEQQQEGREGDAFSSSARREQLNRVVSQFESGLATTLRVHLLAKMARFAREHGLVGNALYREVDDFSITYTAAAYNRTSSATVSLLHTAVGPGTSLHEAACRPLVQHLVPYNQLAQFVEVFWRIFGEFAREVVEARFSSASGASGEVRLAELEAATWFRSLVWGPADVNIMPDAIDQEEEDASFTTLSERPPAGVGGRPSSLQTVLASLLAEMTAVLTRGQNRALQSKIEAILDREETFLRDEFSPWYVAHVGNRVDRSPQWAEFRDGRGMVITSGRAWGGRNLEFFHGVGVEVGTGEAEANAAFLRDVAKTCRRFFRELRSGVTDVEGRGGADSVAPASESDDGRRVSGSRTSLFLQRPLPARFASRQSQSPAPEDGGALSDSEVIVRKDKNSLRCRLSLGKVPALTDVAVATTAADPTEMRGDQVDQSGVKIAAEGVRDSLAMVPSDVSPPHATVPSGGASSPVLSNTPPAHWLDATLVQEVGDGDSTRTLQQGTPYPDGHRSARFFEAEVLPQLGGRLSESERDLLQGVQTEILQHVYPEDCNKYATAEVSSVATELAFVARRPARQSTWRGFFSLFPEGGEELALGEGYEPPAGFTFSVQRSWGDGRGGPGEAETVEEKVSLHLLSDRAVLPSLAAGPADRGETPLRLPIRQLEYIVSTLPPLVFDAFRFLALVLKRAQVLKPVAGDATDGAEVGGTTTSTRGTAHGHDFRLLRDQNSHHIVEFHHMDSDEQHPQLPYTPGENDLVGAEELVALFCLNLEYTTSGNRWRLDLLRTKTLGSLLSKCLWNAEWYLKSVGQDVGPVRYQLLMTADGNYNDYSRPRSLAAVGGAATPSPTSTAVGVFYTPVFAVPVTALSPGDGGTSCAGGVVTPAGVDLVVPPMMFVAQQEQLWYPGVLGNPTTQNFAAQEDMLADRALPECSFFFQPVPAETARGSFFSGAATHGGWETFVGRNRARVLQNLWNLQMALEKRPKDVAAFLEMALLQS